MIWYGFGEEVHVDWKYENRHLHGDVSCIIGMSENCTWLKRDGVEHSLGQEEMVNSGASICPTWAWLG
jgi:hypothetical protein